MKITKVQMLGGVLFAAVVLAGLLFLRLVSDSPPPATVKLLARPEVHPSAAETTTPSPPRYAQIAPQGPATAKSPVHAPPLIQLWASPNETRGAKLDPKSATYLKAKQEGVKPEGRSSLFDPGSLTALASLQHGDSVVIPLLGGERVTGRVNLVQEEAGGWVRVGGELTGPRAGSFSLGRSGNKVGGTILLPPEEIAYAITEQPDGQVLMQEKHLSEVICFQLPRPKGEPIAASPNLGPQEAAPILSSRPTTTAVLYLDFDGATVTDPSWNGGNTIVAQPSSLTASQITQVWNRVKEDFWPFNIDVTTNPSRYNNAPVGKRMRCIITPTCAWYDSCGAGGVAYLDSFDRAGSTFSSTIPCWVFNSSVKSVAEAVSHELGHTLGLNHDGGVVANAQTEGPPGHENEYYHGYFADSGSAVGWAPIMGASYYEALTQWSKGEYANANNREDDIAIIANAANGFGYVADDAGNTRDTASWLNAQIGLVSETGIITSASDSDFYEFTIPNSFLYYTLSIQATPALISPNLDILLEWQAWDGTIIATANPDLALTATIESEIPPFTGSRYYIKVKGTGRGTVTGTGYSNYGSIGHYSLNVSILPGFREGLDGTDLTWTSGGTAPWTGQTAVTHDGVDAAQSGTISHDEESWVETTVTVPGTLTFWWKVSSEANYDYLRFYLNGVLQSGSISGDVDWQQRTFNIGGGTTKLRWRYSKNVDFEAGSDRGWVDQVSFTPSRPVITQQPTNVAVSVGGTAHFAVTATGLEPLVYQWWLNGAPVPGATNNPLTLRNVGLTNQGSYEVVVSNFVGRAYSFSATLTVLQPSNATLRVAAANLTSGNYQHYESPGLNILKGLRPDIVAIQEWNYGSAATGTNTSAAFRAMVNYAFGTNFVYYREPLPGANNIPNGIISRYPILASGWWDDGDANITDRNFVWARLDVPGSNDLYVVSVHLKASNTASDVNRRAVQATNLVNLIATNFPTNAWVVVAGDCNIFDPSEPAYQLLSSRFWDNPTPTDAESGGYPDTNQSRQERYDYVFLSRNLTNQLTPLVMPSHTFSNGLVFDSRVYAPLSDVPPALSTDSGASGMQHMAVLRAINAIAAWVTNRVPGILTQPQGGNFACGTSLTLSVATYGLGPISYQWRRNGNPLPGAIDRMYSFTTASASSGEYSVVITSAGGSVTSSVALVSVYDVTPPVIQPHRDLILVARPGECGALADYRPTATDDCGGSILLTCEPPAGTILPVGRTTVNCTAVDSSGNSNSSSFVVTVYPWGGDDIAGDQWTPHEANRDWRAVASSTNGSRLVAVASSDRIYTSADFGETWTARENSRGWSAVVSSADGRRLLAADDTSHFLYASSDFGTNWVARIAGEPWTALSSSADGSRLLASYYNANAESGGTFVSSDGGTNWDNLSNLAFFSLAASAEGRLVAGTGGAYINDIAFYRSTNYGSNWTAGLVKSWSSVASTTNGLRLLAAAWDDLYLSVNGGTNWQGCGLGSGNWQHVVSSADGRRLFATRDQAIYRSSDFGTNWIAVTNDWFCEALAVSADGNRLVAVEYGGRIHTSIGALPLLTLPTILGATNRTVSATGVEGAIVHFPILATNVCQPSVPVVCTPPSGSLFPPGTNVVFCQAVDGLGQTNVSNFELVVVPLPPLAIAPGGLGFVAGQFGFAITGRNGQIVIIEASSNLQAWTPIWTNTLGSGALPFNDPMSASNGSRFYRVREP